MNIIIMLSIVLLICNAINLKMPCSIAQSASSDPFMSSYINAILLKCPDDKNKEGLCEPQLIVNINFTPNLNVDAADKLLLLDETYEPTTRRNLKIMSPYIISVSRSEPAIMFPLVITNWTNTSNLTNILIGNGNLRPSPYRKSYLNGHRFQNNRNVINPSKCNLNGVKKTITGSSDRNRKVVSGATKTLTDDNINGKPISESDTYSVYNLSAPIPYLSAQIRIFRKRMKTWWRILPLVTLNNLSGTYVVGNLSILLKTHDDIVETSSPLFLENEKILIPNKYLNLSNEPDGLKLYKKTIEEFFKSNVNNMYTLDYAKLTKREDKLLYKPKAQMFNTNQTTLKDSTIFTKILDRCPYNNKTLCLNLIDERVPAFSIKIKMPFRENAAQQNHLKVKLSRIISDATTKDALQISVDVINKGIEAQEFLISICNCHILDTESVTTVKKVLLPYISETITFLLPFITGPKKNMKFNCDVLVKAYVMNSLTETKLNKSARSAERDIMIIAKRSVEIESHSRCFCIWNCRCHCIDKIETHLDANVCQKMSDTSQRDAGLLLNCPPNSGDTDSDLCIMDGNNGNKIKKSELSLLSRYREVIFILILILFLFAIFCSKCFRPRKEDLLVASTEWYCCPDGNFRTQINDYKSREPTPSLNSFVLPKNSYTKLGASSTAADLCANPVNEASNTNCPIDSLESALITLAKQQRELKRHYLKL